MKHVFLAALILCGLSSLTAQTNTAMPGTTYNGVQTPNTVTDKFNADIPNVTPNWSMNGSEYKADYNDAATGMGRSLYYDKNGNVVRREEQLSAGTYPAAVTDYYKQNYPNEKYEVWSSEDATGNRTYYSNGSSETIWFDKNGKYKNRSKLKPKK